MTRTSSKRLLILYALLGLCLLAFLMRGPIRSFLRELPLVQKLFNRKTVDEQLELYAGAARARLKDYFAKRAMSYPPAKAALLVIKNLNELQVYASAQSSGHLQFIHSYKVLAASGVLGPKLKEGDHQVPEGLYEISSLEPNCPFHLGLRVNYPNSFDLMHAKEDGRESPGSDILIHGSDCSIGCIAVGDEASEDLFVLAADLKASIPVLIAPVDFRKVQLEHVPKKAPVWLPELYEQIRKEFAKYPVR